MIITQAEALKLHAIIPRRLESPRFWVEHIPFAFYLISKARPGILLELGTHSGNSFFAFCQAVSENNIQATCYAVDTWKGDKHSGSYDAEVYESVALHKEQNYPGQAVLLRMSFDEALSRFPDKSIDLLNIDGLHTYEGVRHDFHSWLPKLSDSAIVLFHDTQIRMKDFGVWKFWEEISPAYPSFEFHHGCGLGVLAAGKNVCPEILSFLRTSKQDPEQRLFFEQEGKRVMKLYRKQEFPRQLKQLLFLHRPVLRKLKQLFS